MSEDQFKAKKAELKKRDIRRFGRVRSVKVNGRIYQALPYHDGTRWDAYCPVALDEDLPWVGTIEHLVRIKILLEAEIADLQTKTRESSSTLQALSDKILEPHQGELESVAKDELPKRIASVRERDPTFQSLENEFFELQRLLVLARSAAGPIKQFFDSRPSKRIGLQMFYAGEAFAKLQAFQGAKEARQWHQDGGKPGPISDGRKALRGYLKNLKRRPTPKDVLRDLDGYFQLVGRTQKAGIAVKGLDHSISAPALRKWIEQDYHTYKSKPFGM